MSKKIIAVCFILVIAGGAAFSQDEPRPRHNIALHGTILGLAMNYEFSFNRFFSVSADSSVNILPATFTAAVKGRIYPFGRAFYLEMGAGYGTTAGYVGMIGNLYIRTLTLGFFGIEDKIWLRGLVVTPAFGWKIDFGKPGGFTLPLSLGIDWFIGEREIPAKVDFVPNIRLGVGFSF